MDLNMPHLGGIKATKRIHEDQPTICIIGLSVHSSDKLAEEFQSAGAVAFVCKSEPLETLLAAINACPIFARQGEVK